MGSIVFATGGTTRESKFVRYKWEHYEFVTHEAAQFLKQLLFEKDVKNVANCLTVRNHWAAFYLGGKSLETCD